MFSSFSAHYTRHLSKPILIPVFILFFQSYLLGQCPEGITNYWTFNMDDLTQTIDTIGTCEGGSGLEPGSLPDGIAGKANSFDGTRYVSLSNYPSFSWGADLSVALWCNLTNDAAGPMVMLGYDKDASTHWWIGTDGGVPCFYLYDANRVGGGVRGTSSIADGQWHFLVATYNSSTNSQKLYLNGDLLSDSTRVYETSFDVDSDLGMGAMFRNAGWNFHYSGLMDEAALFNQALSETAIQNLYQKGTNGVGYCQTYTLAPEITSSPVLGANAGELYSYNIAASGIPAPQYSLLFAPDVMTIDPSTGVIEWTPMEAGTENIVVEARNSGGSKTQSYTIEVFEPCIDELTSFFKFDEATDDKSSDDAFFREATLVNSPENVMGRVKQALQFNGTDQYLHIPDHDKFDWSQNQSFSIELWCKTEGNGENLQVLIGRETPGSTHWWIGTSSETGTPAFYLYDEGANGGGVKGVTDITDGEWHHIVAQRNSNDDVVSLYIDAKLEAHDTLIFQQNFASEADIQVANFRQGSANRYFYNGLVDEVAIYNRTLTPGEIAEHHLRGTKGYDYCEYFIWAPTLNSASDSLAYVGYEYNYQVVAGGVPAPQYRLSGAPEGMSINSETGLISWLPETRGEYGFRVIVENEAGSDQEIVELVVREECIAQTLVQFSFDSDTSSLIHDNFSPRTGKLTGGPERSEGIIGNALKLNGVDQYAVIDDNNIFDWKQAQSFSIELWCKPGAVNDAPQVIMGRDNPGAAHWWIGTMSTTGNPAFYLYDENRVGGGTVADVPIHDDEWHHIAVVRNGVNAHTRLYVDGVAVADSVFAYTGDFESPVDIHLGNMYINNAERYFFGGLIDEVAIYSTMLTDDEIRAHYHYGRSGADYCKAADLGPMIIFEPFH